MRAIILAAALATTAASTALAQGFDPATLFKQWDANKDGGLSKDEWVAAGRPAERFAAVDADSDGKITPEELSAAIARMQGGQQPPAK